MSPFLKVAEMAILVNEAKWPKMAKFGIEDKRTNTSCIMALVLFNDSWSILDLFYVKRGSKKHFIMEKRWKSGLFLQICNRS